MELIFTHSLGRRTIILITLMLMPWTDCCWAETDITGWGKVRWGMTHSQITKMYKLEKWINNVWDLPSCIAKERIGIHGQEFALIFMFDKESTSATVRAISLHGSIEEEELSSETIDAYYANVYASLIEKYGKPSTVIRGKDSQLAGELRHKKAIWIKKSGKLEYLVSVQDKAARYSKTFYKL